MPARRSETGVDCGGTATDQPCGSGQKSKTSADCVSTCDPQGVCDAPGPTDGKKNNGETDVDCGGANAPKCAVTKGCKTNDDCALLACTNLVCVEPSATDGVQNGGESDVDCGGPGVTAGSFSCTPPRCKDLGKCTVDGDCASGSACSPGTKRCGPRSCATAETAGITTCGAGEPGAGNASHETCCNSLKLPTRARRLDKYEVTAGRFRAFITAVGPNVRKFVTDFRAANPTSQLARLLERPRQLRPQHVLAGPRLSRGGRHQHRAPAAARDDGREVAQLRDADHVHGFLRVGRRRARGRGRLQGCVGDHRLSVGRHAGPADRHGVDREAEQHELQLVQRLRGDRRLHVPEHRARRLGPLLPVAEQHEPRERHEPADRRPRSVPARRDGARGFRRVVAGPVREARRVHGRSRRTGQTFCDFTVDGGAGGCTRSGKPGQTGVLTTGLPAVRVVGRSWEGHVYDKAFTTTYPATFQYGKFGGRCVRPVQ